MNNFYVLRKNENLHEASQNRFLNLKEQDKLFNYQLNQLLDMDPPTKADVSFMESSNDTNSINPYNQIELYNSKSLGLSSGGNSNEEYIDNSSLYLTATLNKNNLNRDGSNCTCM